MIDFISAMILAVIQGITEWVPVSSSGHLVLFSKILGFNGGLGFDVAMHFATLLAVVVYFWKDLFLIVKDFIALRTNSENWKLGWMLILATIPGALAGYFLKDVFVSAFESLWVVAAGFGITGLVLLIASADYGEKGERMNWIKAFWIGIAQAIAIVPGISRSGATISSGLLLGLNEKSALRFSFLMAVPIILGASIVSIEDIIVSSEILWAMGIAFVVGILTIHVLFRHVLTSRKNLKWFGIYALLLALGMGIYLLGQN